METRIERIEKGMFIVDCIESGRMPSEALTNEEKELMEEAYGYLKDHPDYNGGPIEEF